MIRELLKERRPKSREGLNQEVMRMNAKLSIYLSELIRSPDFEFLFAHANIGFGFTTVVRPSGNDPDAYHIDVYTDVESASYVHDILKETVRGCLNYDPRVMMTIEHDSDEQFPTLDLQLIFARYEAHTDLRISTKTQSSFGEKFQGIISAH